MGTLIILVVLNTLGFLALAGLSVKFYLDIKKIREAVKVGSREV